VRPIEGGLHASAAFPTTWEHSATTSVVERRRGAPLRAGIYLLVGPTLSVAIPDDVPE